MRYNGERHESRSNIQTLETSQQSSKPKRNSWKISSKTTKHDENNPNAFSGQWVDHSDKSIEANIDTPTSSVPENHVRFESSSSKNKNLKQVSIKKPSAWVGDFSEVVKRSPASSARHSSLSDSRQQSASSHQSIPNTYPQDFKRPEKLQEIPVGKTSSGYTGSSMSHYNPTEEMKQFFQNEFTNFLESRGTESLGSGVKRPESSYYSSSPSSESGSMRFERKEPSFKSQSQPKGIYRA